jgi:hypothetical protein
MDTVPNSVMPLHFRYNKIMTNPTASQKELLTEIETGKIICPHPNYWQKFFQILKQRLPSGVKLSNPLILAGWAGSNDFEKNQRFRDHLGIAKDNDVLDDVMAYLETLSENDWYYSSSNRLDSTEPSYLEEFSKKGE